MNNYRPQFKLYKANARGTGSAMSFELHPASGSVDGCIFVKIALQKTIGDARGPNPVFPTFDWDNSIRFRLDFSDITQMLQVFRGECESINEEHGLFHRGSNHNTLIKMRHVLDCRHGYVLDVSRAGNNGDPCCDMNAQFFFSPSEALGLCIVFENSLGVICFGVPQVIEKSE